MSDAYGSVCAVGEFGLDDDGDRADGGLGWVGLGEEFDCGEESSFGWILVSEICWLATRGDGIKMKNTYSF